MKDNYHMQSPESFVGGGPTKNFFCSWGGEEDPNITKNGPSSAHQQNAI